MMSLGKIRSSKISVDARARQPGAQTSGARRERGRVARTLVCLRFLNDEDRRRTSHAATALSGHRQGSPCERPTRPRGGRRVHSPRRRACRALAEAGRTGGDADHVPLTATAAREAAVSTVSPGFSHLCALFPLPSGGSGDGRVVPLAHSGECHFDTTPRAGRAPRTRAGEQGTRKKRNRNPGVVPSVCSA
jgi:hypothetical protein